MTKRIIAVLLVLLLIIPAARADTPDATVEKYQIADTDYYTVNNGGYWGIVDGDGNFVVEAIYDSIDTYFSSGRLRFRLNGLYGYFDDGFEVVIEARFLQAMSFYDDGEPSIAQVTTEEGSYYIDTEGKRVSPVDDFIFVQARSGKLVVYARTDMQTYETKCCVYDITSQEQITDYIWDTAVAAPSGLLYLGVRNGDIWAYSIMDSDGAMTQSPVTSRIYRVDPDGYIITEKTFTVTYRNEYFGYESTGEISRFGLVAPDGTIILDNIVECGTGLNASEPLVFIKGQAIIQTGSTEYNTCNDNARYGFMGNGKYGIIDKSGKYVSASDFDIIVYQNRGRFLGRRGETYYVIGMDGSETVSTADAHSRVSNWAVDEIEEAIVTGLVPELVRGYFTFEITRLEFCILAVTLYEKLKGEITVDVDTGFADFNDEFVLKAASIGVVNGYGDGTFRPYSAITREQAATMLGRLYSLFNDLPEYMGEEYADESMISDWALDYVRGIREADIMHGAEVDDIGGVSYYFYPQDTYTIEQAICTMLRLYKKV